MLRRINISAAFIVLICFFLPWEQVSCGGSKDTLTGLDLARHESTLLWLVPLSMLAVLVVGLLRRRNEARRGVLPLVGLIAGALTAYVMNDQRLRVHDESGILPVGLTGWFWFGFISSVAVVISALAILMRRQRPSQV
jgi:hypothetical protein